MSVHDELEECRTTAALFAIGGLPESERARFAQRLTSGCPFCVSEFQEYSSIAYEIASSLPQQQPPPLIRERLLKRISPPPASQQSHIEATVLRENDTPWKKLPVPGVEIRRLLGDKTMLVRMQPGAVFPTHEHRFMEQCYVLSGSVTDSSGMTAYAGDFVSMPAGSTHQPITTETGCVFLIAYT
jgi:quercetin dioxygenase-like cupin family protein